MKTKLRFNTLLQILINIAPILILVGQNLVIFQNHYFRNYGFPWDFSQGYYGITVFWTTLASQGVFPAWVPFDSMGMPFNLVLQSGAHYLPFWFFPLLKVEYTLHAAVIFQCLHVLFGAIGMFYFLRLTFQSFDNKFVYALLGAFVFQFFGGFYSNAEHPDIIRAFSLVPWLFYLFTIPSGNYKISLRYYFIPPMMLLVITGSYPGNLISSIVVISLYALLQLVNIGMMYRSDKKVVLYLFFFLSFMGVLGVGLSAFHLLPSLLHKDYLMRAHQIGNLSLSAFSLGIEHLPALFLDNAMVPGEISMTSTFLTIPALILVSYIPLKIMKEYWIMVFIAGFSALMVAGDRSFFWFVLTKYIDILRLSRFPASDYRVFIAIVLIFFSALSLKALIEDGILWKKFLFRAGIVFLWFFQGVYVSYPILRSEPVYEALAVCIVTLLGIFIFAINRKYFRKKIIIVVLCFLALISWDAYRVLPSMGSWQLGSSDEYYQIFQWPLEQQDGQLLTYEIIENIPASRPARIEKDNFLDYSWDSYTIGQYTLDDFATSSMLDNNKLILRYPLYKNYMLKKWTPLFLEYPKIDTAENNIVISRKLIATAFHSSTDVNLTRVSQTRYGINEIEYVLSLDKPVLMVENEAFFPGWTAVLASGKETFEIQAVSVNSLFRAWLLPAGNYNMTARFKFPFSSFYNLVSAITLLLWILLIYYFMKQKRFSSH